MMHSYFIPVVYLPTSVAAKIHQVWKNLICQYLSVSIYNLGTDDS